MRFVTGLVAMVFALTATASISAQGRGQGQAKKTTVSAPKAKSTETPTHATTKTTKTENRTAKAETKAAKTAAKAETRAAKAETKAARKAGTTTTTTTTTPTDVTATTSTTHTVKNPKLEARLLTLLPGVTDINAASQGFKNWGQFVAAAHVSNNLGIPFADLKARMTGIAPGATVPTTAPMSLGQAIQSWKATSTTAVTPTLTSTQIQSEVKKAEGAANDDLRRSRARS